MYKTMIQIIVFTVLLFSWGCKGSPAWFALASEEDVAALTTDQLCIAYGSRSTTSSWEMRSPKLRHELEQRNLFTPTQWIRIEDRQISVGDSKLLVLAAWGYPDRRYDSSGGYSNWTYRQYGTATYVTFKYDIVTRTSRARWK